MITKYQPANTKVREANIELAYMYHVCFAINSSQKLTLSTSIRTNAHPMERATSK